MTRKIARQIAVRICFSADFNNSSVETIFDSFFDSDYFLSLADVDTVYSSAPDEHSKKYIIKLVSSVFENITSIDNIISSYSSTRRIDRISKTALAVLRCAVAEVLYFDDIPNSVSINEAIEIAKSFDTPETVSFINGILGSICKNKSGTE